MKMFKPGESRAKFFNSHAEFMSEVKKNMGEEEN
jgi:hypothetical protein